MKKIVSYILVIICLILLRINFVEADKCTSADNAIRPDMGCCPQSKYGDIIATISGRTYIGAYSYWHYARQFSHRDVYCVKHGDTYPTYNVCSLDNSIYANYIRAAIGYIIVNYSADYGKTQYLIHRVLELFANGQSVVDYRYDAEYSSAAQIGYNYINGVPGTYYLANLYNCGSGIQPIADGYTTVTIDNIVNIAYHPNGGSTTYPKNQWGWVIYNGEVYFHKMKHGESDDPYNASTLALTRSGYGFSGWQVYSTGQILDQDTVYYSTTYADNSDRNKTSANTQEVYCYLYAQWSEYKLTVNYYDGTTYVGQDIFYYDDDYSTYGLTNYSTFGITKKGYNTDGYWTTSDGKYKVHQDTGFSSGQKLAQALGKNLTNGNATVNVYTNWTPDTYKVIYHGNGGYTSSGQNIITDSFKFYDHYTIKGGDLFSNTDHTFIGWTTNSDGETDDGYNWTGWSGTWIYTNGEYGISNKELHLYARWQDSCVYEFKNTYNNSPTTLDRLNLYKKYHRGAWNSESRRNLLNFRILDAETACGNYTPNYGTNNACLKTDQVNSETENKFTNENLSDYNDRVISSSITDQSYCLTDLELNKGENVGYDSNKTVKAGRMIFNIDKEDAVAKGTITKTCYIHKDVYNNYIGDITKENFINVNDYMDKITLAEVELNQIPIKSEPTSETDGDFYKVEGKVEITYKPNPIYAEKITGKQNNNCVDSTGRINDTCRLLGYGVASKFNDANLTNPSFNFSITPSLNSIFSFNTNDTCPYKVEPEIIKYTNTYKGNVDLEFRVVDTNNPFNRNTKSNWSDGMDNNKNNNKVTEYITNSDVNNSYNRTGNGSLYTNQTDGTRRIILTPDLVQRIREYNEANTYDDYTVYTEEVEGQTKTSTSFFDYIGLKKVQ